MTKQNPTDIVSEKRAPKFGWDNPFDIIRADKFLQHVDSILYEPEEERRCIAQMYRVGLSPEYAVGHFQKRWPEIEGEIAAAILKRVNRYYYEQRERAGSESVGMPPSLDSDGPAEKDDGKPKTLKRQTGGLSWSYGDEIVQEPLTWLWPERIPRGKLTLIAGFPDEGKSQIMLDIAARVTTGSEWPNGEGVAPKGVAIILSSEDGEADTLTPRLAAAGADLKNIVIVRPMVKVVVDGKREKRVLNIQDDLGNLSAIIKQVMESGRFVRMIGFDPINAYFGGGKKADSHKNSDMRALLTPIAEWAENLKITVVAITHFNKGGNGHLLYRVTDSGAITAAARSVYFTSNDEDTGSKRFLPGKHNLASAGVKGLEYSIGLVANKTIGQNVPHIVWGNQSTLTAAQVFSAGKPGSKGDNATANAAIFLEDLLSDGPIAASAVFTEGHKAGHTPHAIRKAHEHLGVESKKHGYGGEDGWYWSLPDYAVNAADFNDEPGQEDENKFDFG